MDIIVGIIRELNKKSLLYFYTIYTKVLWSVLAMNDPTLIFMLSPCFILMSSI